ncbi:hypothetical protein [Nostoc sphaeroides]|uniref:Transposase n=1 Tax=Nostoc sphaeroides CCNUC1 TaxID=2653204 RepID=A0A5P8WD62_9NOSO|nr:hypothetical protein [Nostoc sphaeroides]QFS50757.1 hypothetical protein GXM_08251 [Nostoc sphaeroides CCNUC1]
MVNRTSRKPFQWGSKEGYQQLSAIGQILRSLPCREIDTDYLSLLSVWVDQALSNSHAVARTYATGTMRSLANSTLVL